MKITRVIFCLFALLLALVAFAFAPSIPQTHAAGSGSTIKFRIQGLSALSTFDSVSGCVETYVNVDGTQSGESLVANVFIGQFDICTRVYLLYASGTTFSPDFQVSNSLASASLHATIPVTDYVSNSTFDVSVNMTWTGTGPPLIRHYSYHSNTQGFISNVQSHGTSRDATASGTVSRGTTNFTPEPSLSAPITSTKEGYVTITHS